MEGLTSIVINDDPLSKVEYPYRVNFPDGTHSLHVTGKDAENHAALRKRMK